MWTNEGVVQNRFRCTVNFAWLWCAENELISGDRFITVGWTVKPLFEAIQWKQNMRIFKIVP